MAYLIFNSKSIDVTNMPVKPTIPVADAVAKELSEALGGRWYIAKLGGCWLIQLDKAPVSGGHGQRQHRQLDRAIRDATGLAVVRKV